MKSRSYLRTRQALKIALPYIIVGSLYIFFSDQLLSVFSSNIENYHRISTIKGWSFVLISGILIFFLSLKSIKKIYQSEYKFKMLFQNLTSGIILIKYEWPGKNGSVCIKLIDYNPVASDSLKLTPGMITSNLIENNIFNFSDEHLTLISRVALSETPERFEFYNNSTGKYFHVQIYSPAKYYAAILMDDISEIKEKEIQLIENEKILLKVNQDLEKANKLLNQTNTNLEEARIKAEENERLKSAFLANLSHEIRTPLNAILGFSELMTKEDFDNSKRAKFSEIVKLRSKYLINVFNDLIDFSKIESNQLALNIQKLNVENILIDLLNYYQDQRLIEQHDQVQLRIGSNIDLKSYTVLADEMRIKQVFINLINNALKSTKTGYIEFGCYHLDNELCFYVKDTGIGISQEKFNIIFERFRQSHDDYLLAKNSGTGLGLSICKGLVELMNGRIWLESEIGIGSTFYFILPEK